MNKRASSTVKTVKAVNYPDVLGAITGGKRLSLDVLQVAAASRPGAIEAGKPLDALIVLQNMASIDVDAVIRLLIPGTDLAGNKNRFTTNVGKPIRIGLRPAEVGYANLPLLSTAQTKPGDYIFQIEVQVEQKQRGASRVRDANGGTSLVLADLPDDHRKDVEAITNLNYSNSTAGKPSGNKATLSAPFSILPPVISGLPAELKPGYTTLWTIADYPDEAMLAEKTQALTASILPQLNRSTVFFPLVKTTQAHFENANFRLWAGEAVMIAKLLTLVLENGITLPGTNDVVAVYPRWFVRLCKLLLQNPQAASQLERLVTDLLFADLVYDAAVFGFAMLTTITKEQFGSPDEISAYASHLAASLDGQGDPLDLGRAYLPLVLAGLVANSRVSMPQEQVRDTVNLAATAREKRAQSNGADTDSQTIFKMADDLIERALEHF